ncbi:hypothetical protein DSO57_1012040 [Entomophthora muscae]|uniref:Uncharacterized protein n=1 Tax=Entomophthora muscae TaxID=34485 RepID=A0ACC2RKW4_9FUNG|nr:hypothetical protein DSO57_1012040 [Entomophthora muscae]
MVTESTTKNLNNTQVERIPARRKSRPTLSEQEKSEGRVLRERRGWCQDCQFSPLKNQAQEWDLDHEPKILWEAGPMDQEPARLHLSEIEPLQADTKNAGLCSETGQTKEIIAPKGRLITAPNRGTEAATISFMNLKSTPVAN